MLTNTTSVDLTTLKSPKVCRPWKKIVFLLLFLLLLAFVFTAGALIYRTTSRSSENPPTLTGSALCTRVIPYSMEPRFARALSLIEERTSGVHNQSVKNIILTSFFARTSPLPSIFNCLDIQYCPAETMGIAEGLFYFSPKIASNERLPICVSEKYQSQDDLITAMLLSHEIVHAVQFALWNAGNKQNEPSCYTKEAQAFVEEFMFMFSTTRGELNSLFSRMANLANLDPQVATVRALFEMGISSKQIKRSQDCERTFPQDSDKQFMCIYDSTQETFEEEIRKNPYYREQCGSAG